MNVVVYRHTLYVSLLTSTTIFSLITLLFLVVRWVFAKWTIFQKTSPQFLPYLQSFGNSEIFTYIFSSSSSWGFLKHKHTILLFLLMKHLLNNIKIKRKKSQECKGILKLGTILSFIILLLYFMFCN